MKSGGELDWFRGESNRANWGPQGVNLGDLGVRGGPRGGLPGGPRGGPQGGSGGAPGGPPGGSQTFAGYFVH